MVANGTPAVTHLGQNAYIIDSQTVGVSAETQVSAGKIVGYDSSNYRVRIDTAVN
jgi:hypothetical protein